MTYDNEFEWDYIYIPITEADRPPPQGPPPSDEVIDAVWSLVRANPRRLGEPDRLFDELCSQGLTATRSQIRLALQP